MTLLQVKIDNKLKKAIQKKASIYGISSSSLVRILLVQSFLVDDDKPGNIFNAARDNQGKGIPIDEFIKAL